MWTSCAIKSGLSLYTVLMSTLLAGVQGRRRGSNGRSRRPAAHDSGCAASAGGRRRGVSRCHAARSIGLGRGRHRLGIKVACASTHPFLHHCVAPVGAASADKQPTKTYGGLRGPMCTRVAACVQEQRGQPAAAKPALRSRGLAVEHAGRGSARVGVTPLRSRPQCRSVLSRCGRPL